MLLNIQIIYYRFSHFAKAGGEAFIMGQISVNVSENDMITITVSLKYNTGSILESCPSWLVSLKYNYRKNLSIMCTPM